MKKRVITQKTCFLMGLGGAVFSAAQGISIALGFGPAGFLRMGAFALCGAMLLFLAATENGEHKTARRTKLLLLFLALLVSYFDLPLLCPPLEALVVPLLALLYGQKPLSPVWLVLAALEAVDVFVRTVAIIDFFAPHTLLVFALALVAVSAARFWQLFLLYRRAAVLPPMDENAIRRLK